MCQIDYRYLRPKKAQALRDWYAEDFPCQAPRVWQGGQAVILPLREDPQYQFGRGGVVDSQGNYVPLSAIPLRVEGGYPFEDPEYRDEKVVFCGYLIHHWGHFLVEAVARLWYFLEHDVTVDKYVFFLKEGEERQIRGNYREFLTLLGIWDKLEFISRPTRYRQVLVPELAFRCRTGYSPKYLAVFDAIGDHVVPDPAWKPLDKLYFSRSQLQKGRGFEFGLEVLDDFFGRNGYTILYPEKVPLGQMIYYIRNAQVVATLSGSLPHNMLFARPGQRLEILERCVPNNDFQVGINRMKDLRVTYIDANLPIYPVDMCGPFIMGCTDCLERFAQDRGYALPQEAYRTEGYLRRCFIRYMKSYQDLYRYQWYMQDWYQELTPCLWEAYQAGHAVFGPYLDGSKPFLWHHYFTFHYWKQGLKALLRKLGSYHNP